MTRLMEQAIERLQALPESEQDGVAQFLLHQLQEDERWAVSTAANAGKLEALIGSVLEDDAAGKCEQLDPESL